MQQGSRQTIAELLDSGTSFSSVVGREDEMVLLDQLSTDELPIALFLCGIPGIGKTALLNAYLNKARQQGIYSIHIDANRIEPTASSFNGEIARILKVETDSVVEQLAQLEQRVVIAIDNYQALRLLDRWLREEFLPRLSTNVRMLIACSFKPGPGWSVLAPWNSLSRIIELTPLSAKSSVKFLLTNNFSISQAQYIQSIARGYPMALSVASSILNNYSTAGSDESFSSRLMIDLAQAYLETIEDSEIVNLLKELALLRRVTLPILTLLSPNEDPKESYHSLREIAFVKETDEGLMVHDALREALATKLNAENPARVREVKRLVWSLLAAELKETHDLNLWRFTADTIYLLSDPVIREAFFPRDVPFFDVVPAAEIHGNAIREISSLYEGDAEKSLIEMWWQEAHQCFKVVLNEFSEVAGFYLAIDPGSVGKRLLERDPLTSAWLAHIKTSRMPSGQRAYFIRRWLAADVGESPSPVQAAAWLDMKRTYLEMWPALRHVYLTVTDLEPYKEIATRLGFTPLQELSQDIGQMTFYGAVLDMGPASVNGWLHSLLARELGINPDDFLDPERQVVLVDGEPVELTTLEFKVAAFLYANAGNAVSRERLLNNVWGTSYQGGSNVVDAVITNLRRKLGNHANKVQTVRGHGYALVL